MASDDIDNKALTKMLAEAFKHLTGYSKFRKLNASMEAAIENLFDDESDWSDIVSEGNKKISAASRVIGVLKKRERFYKELGGLIGKPAKSTDEELSRYLKLMDSPLEKAIASDKKWTYALGADTGVRDDFSYLRDTEIRQNERRRFDTMMSQDLRKSLGLPDDLQYALGADTGVRDDFSYLREEEEDQTRRNIRRNRTKRSRKVAVALEGMDDYERFIHENKGRFGRDGAEQVFRQRLLKELPPFFKDSKLSTKTLLAISKSLAGVKKTPFIGPMLGRMVQNPVAGASAAVYGAMVAAFGASDKANTTTIGWENAANLYGVPSKKFQDAAFLAGLKDPGEISRLYGKLTAQFGDPEMAIGALGSAMGGMSSRERTFMAKDLGIDETTMALIDILSGNKHLNVGETRRTAANRAKLDVLQSLGYTSGSGVGSWLQSLFLSIPGMKGGAARDMELLPHVRQGYNDDLDILMFDAIERNIKGAADAADSLSSSESYGGGDTTNNSVSSTNTALIINTMNVNGKDAMEIANGLKDIADSTLGSRANVLNAMDSRVAV